MKSKFYLERIGQRYSIRLHEGENKVGRCKDAVVRITGTFGSRNHCIITINNDTITLSDYSSNGTFVNEIEFKNVTTCLQVNDKIGIGVHSVDDFLENSETYHVYKLQEIKLEEQSLSNNIEKCEKNDIVKISDSELESSDDEEIIFRNCSKKSDLKILSTNIAPSTSNNSLKKNCHNPEDDKNTKFEKNPKIKENAIDRSSLEKRTDLEDFQSDELSQAIWDEIKQEIVDLDISELQSNSEVVPDLKNDIPITDYLDLTLDDDALKKEEDDDELDDTTRKWFIKLSQNFDDSFEKKPRHGEKPSYSCVKNSETQKGMEISIDKDQQQPSIPCKHSDNRKNNQEFQALDEATKSTELEPARNLKHRRNSIFLIDPPSLPTKKGKLRGFCAEKNRVSPAKFITSIKNAKSKTTTLSATKSPKKNLRAHYSDAQSLKKQKKWLEKPNTLREKLTTKQVKERRKEKLKLITNKGQEMQEKPAIKDDGKRKHSVSADDLLEDERKNALKKTKVKVTETNRGSFLTGISNVPATKIPNRRKSVDVGSSLKSKLAKPNDFSHSIEMQINDANSNGKNRVSTSKQDKSKNSQKTKSLKSCLKSFESFSNVKSKTKKTVRFKSEPVIHLFVAEKNNNNSKENMEIKAFNNCNNKNAMQPDLSHFEGRRRMWLLKCPQKIEYTNDNILTDILSWKPEWFNDGREHINANDRLCPMFHSFNTFEDYRRVILPLMKLELWERLVRDYKICTKESIALSIKKIFIEEKLSVKKIIYNCEYYSTCPLNRPVFYASELISMQIKNHASVFGFVRTNICINPNAQAAKKLYHIIIETNFQPDAVVESKKMECLNVIKVSVISTELGAFDSVKNLVYSPLSKKILNPKLIMQNQDIILDDSLKNYKYNAYDTLNEVQQNILMRTYLRAINPHKDSITLIEGPPGTGKSKLITNLILQLQYGHEVRPLDRKILVCAQSNTAVDVIAQKLIRVRKGMGKKKFNLVRYGVLDKMHPEVKPYSLTELIKLQIKSTEPNRDFAGLKEEKELLEQKIKKLEITKYVNSRDENDLEKAKKDLNQINSFLNESSYKTDRNLEYNFLANANIVCTTLSSCVRLLRYCNYFDVCIIDEATQCNEPWTLVPLQCGISSLILIGDTQQLPATTLSSLCKTYNFGKSYFTRAKESLENSNESSIMSLKTQYRMHPEICQWPNSYFYKNLLLNGEPTTSFEPLIKPYSVIELNFNQNKTIANGNISNCSEADFVIKLVQSLIQIMPIKKYSYGIITPYNLHCQNLRQKLRNDRIEIEVNTIDSYQGKEKDVIIISNARTEGVGFLNEMFRLNVALTRARKCLILCGNFKQLQHLNVWKSLLSNARTRNVYFEPTSCDLTDFDTKIFKRIKL